NVDVLLQYYPIDLTKRDFMRKAATDEQDMLNDVMMTAFANQTIVHRTMREVVKHTGGDAARQEWDRLYETKLKWTAGSELPLPNELCESKNWKRMAPQLKTLKYNRMHSLGEAVDAEEYGSNAPDWLFGGQLGWAGYFREPECIKPRTSWQERVMPATQVVTHMVGPPHNVRHGLMRALGYHHYYPVDMFHMQFPMDNSRILAVADVPKSGLFFQGGIEDYKAFVKKMIGIAAVVGRTFAAPVIDCRSAVRAEFRDLRYEELITRGPVMEEFFQQIPCPDVEGGMCCVWTPAWCERDSVVLPVDVDFWQGFLRPEEMATVDATGKMKGDAAPAEQSLGFDLDDWMEKHVTTASLDVSTLQNMLELQDKALVFIKFSADPDGNEMSRNVASSLRYGKGAKYAPKWIKQELLGIHCVDLKVHMQPQSPQRQAREDAQKESRIGARVREAGPSDVVAI
ncbi:hypothetical protein CYMTET_28366, partial [Cymbomonas tetramitiformis]